MAPPPGAGVAASAAVSDSKGVLLMFTSEIFLALTNVVVKFVGDSWPMARMMTVRYSLDFVLCGLLCAVWQPARPSRTSIALMLCRGVAYYLSMICFWGALRSCLPLGDCVVLLVAISPLFLVSLSWLLLGEQIPKLWPFQVVACAVGAIMIDKPGIPDRTCPAYTAAYPLAAAFFFSFVNLLSRYVKEQPPPVVMMFNDTSVVLVAVIVTALTTSDPSAILSGPGLNTQTGLVAVSALLGWAGLLCNVRGYQSVSVAAIASIAGYSSVPLGYILQVLVFGEVPDVLSALGAMLIISINVAVAVSKYFAAKAATKELEENAYKVLPDGAANPKERAVGA